jgi:adenine-specific DNA-methyltransferase
MKYLVLNMSEFEPIQDMFSEIFRFKQEHIHWGDQIVYNQYIPYIKTFIATEFPQLISNFLKHYPFIQKGNLFNWILKFLRGIYKNGHLALNFQEFRNNLEEGEFGRLPPSWHCETLVSLIPKYKKTCQYRNEERELNCILLKNEFLGSEKTSQKKYFIPAHNIRQNFFNINQIGDKITIFWEYRPLTLEEKQNFSKHYQKNILSYVINEIKKKLQKKLESHDLFGLIMEIYTTWIQDYVQSSFQISYFYPKPLSRISHVIKDYGKSYLLYEILLLSELTSSKEEISKILSDLSQILLRIGQKIAKIENIRIALYTRQKFVLDTDYGFNSSLLNEIQNSKIKKALKNMKHSLDKSKVIFSNSFEPNSLFANKDLSSLIVIPSNLMNNIIGHFTDLDDKINGWMCKGENWQVLELLKPKFHKQISVVYIDPPYNTGTRDFHYIDSFKRLDWLFMMDNRVKACLSYLTTNGIFFSSIDDNQVARYALLIEQHFPARLDNIIWHKKTQPSYLSKELISVTEYIIVAKMNKDPLKLMGSFGNPDKLTEMINIGNKVCDRIISKDRVVIGNCWTGILEQKNYGRNKLQVSILNGPIKVKEGKPSTDLHLRSRFKWIQDRIESELKNGGVIYIKSIETLRPTIERKYQKPIIKAPTTLLSKKVNNIPTNTDANMELKNLFKIPPFDYSKPTGLIRYLVRAATYFNPEGWILDFFAGSGSTAQAVLQQNDIDHGLRKYLLIEQSMVHENVLMPRIRKVMVSKVWENGIPSAESGYSHFYKSIRIETMDDAYLNLDIISDHPPKAKMKENIGQYLYKLNYENDSNDPVVRENSLQIVIDFKNDSNSIGLNISEFVDPFNLSYIIGDNGIIKSKIIDLVETFNLLLGLKIFQHQHFDFDNRPYQIVQAHEPTPQEKNLFVIVIWRPTQNIDLRKEWIFLDKKYNFQKYGKIYMNHLSLNSKAIKIEPILIQKMFSSSSSS